MSARVVLLTGAAGGIGRVMAAALLADGHSVAAVDRDGAGLEQLTKRARREGASDRLHAIVADLQDERAGEAAVAEAKSRFGTTDAVINNAGIGMSSIRPDAEARHPTIEELTPAIWDAFLAIFVRAPVVLARAALPSMKQSGWGRIVNNTTSYLTMLRVLPYGAAKAAFESLSAVWAKELDGSGITANVLVPGGPTDTPLISDASGWPREKMLRPEIMGPPTRWLISDGSDGFNGQRITAARWDVTLPAEEAARRASRPIGWPELAVDAVWLEGS
ncbi:MAG: SDR family NAD(P)-dependent oxidoreductase [Xanthobacteraceae bacterium]|jgi:NAD(P)-dependent dehydrogenase (short-subunit alcohol dehydrogenase family)